MITDDQEVNDILRLAAARAALAPSIHNTQPWRFRISGRSLELRANPDRQLQVIDPGRRQLMISCGCALFNARVAIAASRREVLVERFPAASDDTLIARLTLGEQPAPWTPLVRLDGVIDRRRSNRREFFDTDVSEETLWELTTAGGAEDAVVVPIAGADRTIVTELVRDAQAAESADPRYLAELRQWTTDRGSRGDGVSARSYPQASEQRGDIPLRDFAVEVTGQMPPLLGLGPEQCLLVVGTRADDQDSWLRAGEALQRLWLEATRLDHVASVFSQPVEVRETRQRLRSALGLSIWPQVLLRVGQAAPNVATRRRPLDEMLDEPVPQPSTR